LIKKKIGFDKVYDRYRKDEFYSPFRSTVPLLDLIKNGKEEMLQKIVNELGVVGEHTYHLEYRVKLQNGKGSASHTDLWVETESHVLGIEAKWTERRYMKVGKWLQEGSNPENRRTVLGEWLDKLYCPSTPHPGIDEMRDQIYQMVHRAASVYGCDDKPKTKKPILAYVQFTEELQLKKKSYIHQDLSSLWSILGKPEKFPFYYVQVLIERNEAFKHIEHLEKRSVETGKKVKEALSGNEPLFTYKDKKIVKIGEA
jgi:hypothetical protein